MHYKKNALKFFHGFASGYSHFYSRNGIEITPNALSLAPDTNNKNRILKRTNSYWNTKKSIEANYYPSFYHLPEDILHWSRS
jgi:hypothetical protein